MGEILSIKKWIFTAFLIVMAITIALPTQLAYGADLTASEQTSAGRDPGEQTSTGSTVAEMVQEAQAFTEQNPSAADGYIVKLSEDAPSLLTDDTEKQDMESVAPGLFQVDELDSISEYQEAGLVEYIEPNYCISLFEGDSVIENRETGWAYEAMHGDEVAALGLNGGGVRIAVIDSGIDPENSELQHARIATGFDYIERAEQMQDPDGHGTMVARMIAGDDNTAETTGLARGATLIPLRCFMKNHVTTAKDLIPAINDAVNTYDCDIINMSWGMESDSTALHDAIKAAADKGVILVAAAGNVDSDTLQNTVLYPAAYDEVVGVGSVKADGAVASSSQKTRAVAVCAPGNAVIDGYSGTSFAAPCVSAAAALVLQLNPGITPEAFMQLLQERTEDRGETGYDTSYGWGFVRLDYLFGRTWMNTVETENTIEIHGWFRSETLRSIAAAFSAEGRMKSIEVRRNEGPISALNYSILAQTGETVKLFFLNDINATPLRDNCSWKKT